MGVGHAATDQYERCRLYDLVLALRTVQMHLARRHGDDGV